MKHLTYGEIKRKKVPNVLSRCHTKRRMGAEFSKKKKQNKQKQTKIFKTNSKKSVSYKKKDGRDHAFGMTTLDIIGTFL